MGTIAFVTTGPNSRGTQLFVNYDDNHLLMRRAPGLRRCPLGASSRA